jgi:malate synthase
MNIVPCVRLLAFALAPFALACQGTCAGVDGVESTTGHYWSSIQADTYSQRDAFTKGVDAMSARLNDQIAQLKAKRAAMTADTDEWDFSMKEVDASRALLTGYMTTLAKATTPDTWEDAKTKIGEAWHRSQLAVDAMNATRTT